MNVTEDLIGEFMANVTEDLIGEFMANVTEDLKWSLWRVLPQLPVVELLPQLKIVTKQMLT